MTRSTWDAVWMSVARDITERRCYDKKLKVGALVVTQDNSSVLALGYNGNAAGLPNRRDSMEAGKSGFIHAEVNCLIKLDYHHPSKKTMYITHSPCSDCAKLIVQAKIDRVVYGEVFYRDPNGIEILKQCGVEVACLDDLPQTVE